ncbi:MAG: Rrf2 family transcriptional regulator [bacterium]|nr:Rrf2 family transcriptional regulator [bacterium]
MNITVKTEYALRALQEVIGCEDGKPITRRKIAQKQGISEHFLEKIFIGLQKKDIIRSIRGPGGGFILNREPGDITLWDVYTAVDEPDYHEEYCYEKAPGDCAMESLCQVKDIWFTFGKIVKESMTGITLGGISNKGYIQFGDNSKENNHE